METFLLRLMAHLPFQMALGIGHLLGLFAGVLPIKFRRIADRNLELCLPDVPLSRRNGIRRRSCAQFGCTLAEAAHLLQKPPETYLERITAVHGLTPFQDAIAAGRGLIIANPHLGSWEIVGLFMSQQGKLTTMYRAQKRKPELDRIMLTGRQRLGATLVPADGSGVRALMGALKRGEMIGLLPDQDPKPTRGGAIFAPFFDVPAHSGVLLSKLAQKTGAPVFMCHAKRLPGGLYELHIEPGDPAIHDADLLTSVTAVNRQLENLIERTPEQYWWSYARFKRRPEGATPVY